MKKPELIPPAVIAGLTRYCSQHESVSLADLLEILQFDCLCGCYYFDRNGMYHGVELNGYIHT